MHDIGLYTVSLEACCSVVGSSSFRQVVASKYAYSDMSGHAVTVKPPTALPIPIRPILRTSVPHDCFSTLLFSVKIIPNELWLRTSSLIGQ
jgi:hypothetical protein